MLNNFLKKPYWFAFVSGILSFCAVLHMVFLLAWVCYVLFFIFLKAKTIKQSIQVGIAFGAGLSIPTFYWMIPGAEKFTGASVVYGLLVFLLSSLIFCVYWAVIGTSVNLVRVSLRSPMLSVLLNALLVSSVWTLGEAGLNSIFPGMPWFAYNTGFGVLKNLSAIQLASVFGLPVISFVIVFVNFLISEFVAARQWKQLLVPGSIMLVYMLIGYTILVGYKESINRSNTIKVAILAENFPPEMKWDNNNGNILVNRLLELEKEAVRLKPQLALWSESSVPWTYRTDDDFVKEVCRISASAGITHVIGINSDYSEKQVCNSVYCLLPDGLVAGRYDKRFLLDFIEKPVGGILIPFLSGDGSSACPGDYAQPLNTPFGKAGIMICNEATLEKSPEDMIKKGAQFFLTLSNDGWFRDSYIVGLHFYNLRLRAIETRKDIAVNSNYGISGLVEASGRIQMQQQSSSPFIKLVNIHPNNFKYNSFLFRKLFLGVCAMIVIVFSVLKFRT
ncbi:MAG: apolipoprotein N-acyltransferase [Bacteroidota bacterium]|nr:apolipoprotein N-acyltransferase [Bacteroidota bacterium]